MNDLNPIVGELAVKKNERISPAISYLAGLSSNRSRETMISILNIVADIFGFNGYLSFDWSELSRMHMLLVIEKLKEKELSPATINTYVAALKGVAKEAWLAGFITGDVYQHIKLTKGVRGSRLPKGRLVKDREIASIFSFLRSFPNEPKHVRNAAILGIMFGCGLRRAEVVALNMENINSEEQCLTFVGKGNKERAVYMPDDAFELLLGWLAFMPKENETPIFCRVIKGGTVKPEERLSDSGIYFMLKEVSLSLGLSKTAPHDLRRTFATMLLDDGVDINTVKEAMGHSSITTTQRYDMRDKLRLKRASKAISLHLKD